MSILQNAYYVSYDPRFGRWSIGWAAGKAQVWGQTVEEVAAWLAEDALRISNMAMAHGPDIYSDPQVCEIPLTLRVDYRIDVLRSNEVFRYQANLWVQSEHIWHRTPFNDEPRLVSTLVEVLRQYARAVDVTVQFARHAERDRDEGCDRS